MVRNCPGTVSIYDSPLLRSSVFRVVFSTTNSYRIVVIALFVVVTALVANAQAKSQQQTKQGSSGQAERKQSIVRGRVIYDETQRPLRRVQVTVYDPATEDRRRQFVGWTNRHGEFRIKELRGTPVVRCLKASECN